MADLNTTHYLLFYGTNATDASGDAEIHSLSSTVYDANNDGNIDSTDY